MKAAKAIVRRAMHACGVVDVARFANRGALRVLMYHRFADRARLESQCRQIVRTYAPISMEAVARWLMDGSALPSNALAVTIDDGYRCCEDNAYPVFSQFGIPLTVYLATDFIDGVAWFWDDQVRFAFQHTTKKCIPRAAWLGSTFDFTLDSELSRSRAALEVIEAAKLLTEKHRKSCIADVLEMLQVRLPSQPPGELQPLTWDGVRRLARNGVVFGAHTMSHPILSRLGSEEEVRVEVEGSRRRIEQELNAPVIHFCYPNGRKCDIDTTSVAAVRSAGFRTAVTSSAGLNQQSTEPLLLRRIGVDADTPALYLEECLAGFHG